MITFSFFPISFFPYFLLSFSFSSFPVLFSFLFPSSFHFPFPVLDFADPQVHGFLPQYALSRLCPPLQFFCVGVLFDEDFAGKVISVQFVGIYGFDDDALPVLNRFDHRL